MTEAEWRIRDFSSGMKKLGNCCQNYIHRLTNILFLVEQSLPPMPADEEFSESVKKK